MWKSTRIDTKKSTFMRTKNLISFPRYNRRGGDLTKKWYVEFAFVAPDGEQHRYRVYSGLCKASEEERDSNAKQLVEYYTEYLKSGEYLNTEPNLNPLKEKETYRPETQRWLLAHREMLAAALTQRFLNHIKPTVRIKTYQDYKCKLQMFVEYVEKHQNNMPITSFNRAAIFPFFEMLANDRKLCRQTITKYMQVVRIFFNWCEDAGVREYETNPVKRIPKMGKIIDCAPGVFDKSDRERLRDAIKPKEPWLWLACEILYYCAIRPGTEMRLLKVGDIDLQRKTICVRAELAKNKTTEVVVFPDELRDHMISLCVDRYDKDLYLFGKYGCPAITPMGKNTMRNRFNLYREKLRISEDKKFYSWKHSGAISAIENGATIYEVKDQLRHKSIVTTEEYLKKRVPNSGVAANKMEKI